MDLNYKLELTPYQVIFYYEWLKDPKRSDYNMVMDIVLCGKLDLEKCENAFLKIVNEHLVFMSNVVNEDDSFYWIPREKTTNILHFHPNILTDNDIYEIIAAPFDLEKDLLARLHIIKLDKEKFRVILLFPHLVIDGLSTHEIYEKWADSYNGIDYDTYPIDKQIKMHNELLAKFDGILSSNKREMEQFWRKHMIGLNGVDLTFLKSNVQKEKSIQRYVSEYVFCYDESVFSKLLSLRHNYKITPYIFGQLVLAVLLNKISGEKNIPINYPIALLEGADFIFGAHINSMIIDYRIDNETTLDSLITYVLNFFKDLKRTKAKYFPVSQIVQYASNANVLEIAFAQTFLRDHEVKLDGITIEKINHQFQIDMVNKLLFEQELYENRVNYRIKYDKDILDAKLVGDFVVMYQKLFDRILQDLLNQNGDIKITSYQLLTKEESKKISSRWNNTKSSYIEDKTLTELFKEQVCRKPNSIAVICDDRVLTYDELNKRSNRLAHYLKENMNIQKSDNVVLCVDKSEHLLVLIMAILKVGAVYVPVNPAMSDSRISYILLDTDSKAIFTNKIYQDRLKYLSDNLLIIDDKDFTENNISNLSSENLDQIAKSDDLAYIIYTSETSGNPKGVMVEHRNVHHLVVNTNYVDITENDNILSLSNYQSYGSIYDFFAPLINGATVVLSKKEVFLNLDELDQLIDKHTITNFYITTAFFNLITDANLPNLGKLKYILFGGEAISLTHVRKFKEQYKNVNLVHVYGTMETASFTTYYRISENIKNFASTIPIGCPITNTTTYILDKQLDLLPIGAIGELYIGGAGVGRGYLNNPELSAERFLPNPFQSAEDKRSNYNGIIYKTGDLVRLLPDGNIEYVKRNDLQVRKRDFRIKSSETESVIALYGDNICNINILSTQDIELLRNVYNKTDVPYPRDTNLVAIFEQQVELNPDRIAVSIESNIFTYRELNQHANKLANYLIGEGIVPGNVVGLLFERSLDMIVGMLGVLKTGGAYLPIDPTLPEKRINYMLSHSQAVFLLSQEKYLDPYIMYLPTQAIDSPQIVKQNNTNVSINILPTDLAYCIFTSGSSGKPKGVLVNHRSIINLVKGLEQEVYQPYGDRILKVALLASFSFDASVQQIYGSLLQGHSLYIADNISRSDGEKLKYFFIQNSIDLSDGTPTHLRLLTDTLLEGASLGNFSSWILAGEVLPKELVKEFYGKVGKKIQLYNFYGPTETCVDSTSYKIDIDRIEDYPSIPIGKPLPNERVYITDSDGNLVPIGVIGELCIAGDGLAQRYIGDEAITSEKFRNDWISGEERIYRTGDMVRWLQDGNLEYHGRIDSQIKIRGYRIELLEIENQLNMHPHINYCAVSLKEIDNEKYLIAYYESSSEIAVSELRYFLSHSLPDYMIPQFYMWVNQLPLNNNGKVDRNSLPDYIFRNSGIHVPPSSEIEKKLVKIWADVLKINAKSISTTNNFFDLGGQSLKLVFVANRIKDAFNVSIGLQKLTSLQNIQELAKEISASVTERYFKIPRINTLDFYPLSYAQKQFYLLNQLNNTSTAYNQPQALLLEGNLDKNRLQYTFQKLIAHHESFRTIFKIINDSPVQYILDKVMFELEYFESSLERCNVNISKFIRPFDLSIAPLLRACLIWIEEEKHLLIIDRHHIISDGLSLDIFMRDFMLLYQGKELSSVPLEYRNYAIWQQEDIYLQILADQKLYWSQIFAEPFTNIALPTDYERPAIISYNGAKVDFNIDFKQTQLLKDLARSLDVMLFSVVLGIFKILLYKLSGQNNIILGTPVSGRRNIEIEHTIGVFINLLPIRSQIEPHDNAFDFLKKINQNVIQGLENQDYPFEKLVTDLGIIRNVNRNPLYDVMFVYREEEPLNITLQDVTFTTYELDTDTSQMDLILHVNATKNGMRLSFQYATDLFEQASIENFIQYFNRIVDQIILNTPIYKINIIDVVEQELIKKFNNSDSSFEINLNIVEIFEKQANEFPDRKAVVFDGVSLSYKELNERSNQLAASLIDKSINKGDIIGLLLNRNADIIIGILGILKSGGAYLPIDYKLPFKRICQMLESSNAKLLLGHMEHLEIFCDQIDIHDINSSDIKSFKSENIAIERYPSDLTYCIFTSGSTGIPKGVLIEDRSIVNLVMGLNYNIYENFDSALRIGLIASYSFDASCQQIYSALLNAHTLIICNENERADGEALYNFYKHNDIQVSDGTPTHLGMFLKNLKQDIHLPELKAWLLAGEVLSKEQVLDFYGHPDLQHIALYNLYGPTEACVDCTCYKIDILKLEQFNTIPIGRPLPNERIYIVDEFGNSVPKGVIGELCVAGVGLARGYIGNISDNKFVKNWIKGEERVYKSGDLAQWFPDGNIIYKGRIDNQIKMHGYRIEPGEIEQVLLSHIAVKESIITLVNIDGENYLTAYYTSNELLDEEQLRDYLTLRLPQYMIPSFFVQLDLIPLTPNGKVNRNALPPPNRVGVDRFVGASTKTEKKMINIWADALNINPQSISINQSFLQLGGNSLSAVQIANKIKREFKIEIKLVDLFQKVTILEQGNYIDLNLWLRDEDHPIGEDNHELNI